VLGAIIALGLLAAATGRRWLTYAWVLGLVAMSGLALYDMWQWGYQYGHNLDPKAAISIPDMTYQPPLIGFKQLLNFGAWSLPDIGGWVLGAALMVGVAVSAVELCLSRPNASNVFCRWVSRRAAEPRPVGV
jgi:copper chaperone NosL